MYKRHFTSHSQCKWKEKSYRNIIFVCTVFLSFTLWMTCERTLIFAQSTLWIAPQNLPIYVMELTEFHLWVLPLVTWIDGFSDWISMECMFKILQFHNLWDNECKMDEYCFRFALWRWNSPFVEASAEHKCSERFIAMFNATKHNICPFHIHVFINMSDCNILFITEIIKFNLKIRNTTYRRQFISETQLTPDRF